MLSCANFINPLIPVFNIRFKTVSCVGFFSLCFCSNVIKCQMRSTTHNLVIKFGGDRKKGLKYAFNYQYSAKESKRVSARE